MTATAAAGRWPFLARIAAGAAVAAIGAVTVSRLGWSAPEARAVAVGAAVLVFGLLGLLVGPIRSPLAAVGVAVDVVAIALLLVWTGGLGSPLLVMAPVYVAVVGFAGPARAGALTAAGIVLAVGAALVIRNEWSGEAAAAAAGGIAAVALAALAAALLRGRTQSDGAAPDRLGLAHELIRTAVEGIVVIDERGIMLSVNPATERIFDYPASELIGRNVSMLMAEPDRSRHDAYIASYVRTRDAKIIGIGREVTGRRRSGEAFPIDLAVSEVQSSEGPRFMGIVRDITSRKRAEIELRELNRKLREQQQALVQHEKMVAMGHMAAGVAHEVTNPLASMDSLLQLAERSPQRMNAETMRLLREQIERIQRIIRDMTAFAHPSETSWQTVELGGIVDSALDLLRFDHRLRAVSIDRRIDHAGAVRMMPDAIQQVVVNLVMNAVDALAGHDAPRIEVATSRDAEWAVLEVSDNGSGIAPEHLDHVFEPFFTTKPVGRGTGLGLSISWTLIERHGGRIAVRSQPGSGAVFTVRLPIADGASRGGDAASKPDSRSGE